MKRTRKSRRGTSSPGGGRRKSSRYADSSGDVVSTRSGCRTGISLGGSLPEILLIVVVGCFAFWPSLDNQFVHWDDFDNLVQNEHIREISAENIQWMMQSDLLGVWQPLAWLFTAVEYQLFTGQHLPSFRLGLQYTSIVLHLIAAILCFLVTTRLVTLAVPQTAERCPAAIRISGTVSALLFVVHPLRVEAVAWASGQPYVLATIGGLGSLLSYLRACRTGRWRWHVLAFACLAASFLCKSIAVPLVAVFLVLDVYPLRRIGGASRQLSLGGVLGEKIPYIALTLLAMMMALRTNLATQDYQPSPPMVKALVMSYAVMFYAAKTSVPMGIAPYYARPQPIEGVTSDPWFLAAAVSLVGITIFVVVMRRRQPWLLCAWICHVLMVAPISGVILHGGQLAADRYSYVSCIGWAVLGGALVGRLWVGCRSADAHRTPRAFTTGQARWRRMMLVLLSCTVVLVLGIRTRAYCSVWRDSISLLKAMVESNPQWPNGPYYLGKRFSQAGDPTSAERFYRKAIEVYPGYPEANVNLGILLQRKGDLEEAADHYRRALGERPGFHMAHYNLGCLLYQQGSYRQAVQHFKEAEAGAIRRDKSLLPVIRQRLDELGDLNAADDP